MQFFQSSCIISISRQSVSTVVDLTNFYMHNNINRIKYNIHIYFIFLYTKHTNRLNYYPLRLMLPNIIIFEFVFHLSSTFKNQASFKDLSQILYGPHLIRGIFKPNSFYFVFYPIEHIYDFINIIKVAVSFEYENLHKINAFNYWTKIQP